MSGVYEYLETSTDDGRPIELFEFRYGAKRWRYTNADRDLYAAGGQHEALAIERSGITQSGEKSQDDMTITIPSEIEIIDLFRVSAPAEPIYVFIRSMHYGGGAAPIIWAGKLTSVGRDEIGVGKLTCRTLTATVISSAARLTWDRNCPHMLYDEGCKVNKADHADNIRVEEVNGTTLVVSGLNFTTEDYYSAGFIEWMVYPGTYERRGIKKHVADTFQIFGSTDGITVGKAVVAYPGCARTAIVCNGKFNNIENYGGFPHIPGKSPFDGDPVF
jgi:uncharacterized phage protein (TIGR02218 family)